MASKVPLALMLVLASCGANIFAVGVSATACARDAECGSNAYCEIPLSNCAEGGAVVTGPGVCHRSCQANACVCTTDADCPGSTCSQGSCGNIHFKIPVDPCPGGCAETELAEAAGAVCLCQSCPTVDGGNVDGGEFDAGPADAGEDGGSPCSSPYQLIDGYCSGPCNSEALCICADGSEAGASCPESVPMACAVLCADHGGWCPSFLDGGTCDLDGGPADAGTDDGGTDGGAADAGGVPCGDAGTCDGDQLCFETTGCGGVVLVDAGAGGCRPTTYSCQSPGMCAQTPTCGCFQTETPCEGSTLCSVDGGVVSCQFDYP